VVGNSKAKKKKDRNTGLLAVRQRKEKGNQFFPNRVRRRKEKGGGGWVSLLKHTAVGVGELHLALEIEKRAHYLLERGVYP